MLDIKFIRENPDLVKENIRKKFQNAKLPLVDEVIALDSERREAINAAMLEFDRTLSRQDFYEIEVARERLRQFLDGIEGM